MKHTYYQGHRINRIRLEFKAEGDIAKAQKAVTSINRIRLEFKDSQTQTTLQSYLGINRIRLEFKVG